MNWSSECNLQGVSATPESVVHSLVGTFGNGKRVGEAAMVVG